MQLGKRNALLAIAVGGLIAGALDITQAIILFGKKVPLVIAAGLLGKGALHDGGAGTYVLGLFLQLLHRHVGGDDLLRSQPPAEILDRTPFVCGLFYGAAVDQVMTLIVLPLSALHAAGPYKLHDLLLGIIVHSVVIGLPISFSVRRFAR